MPTLTIKEKLKTLFEEHSLHKKYKEQDIVYLTIDGDIGFYQALRNIPRYIPITDDRWWRRLNKREVDSITPTPTPEPDPDPTPEVDTARAIVGYNSNECDVELTYMSPPPTDTGSLIAPQGPFNTGTIIYADCPVGISGANVTMICTPKEGYTFVRWEFYTDENTWLTLGSYEINSSPLGGANDVSYFRPILESSSVEPTSTAKIYH